MVDGFEFDGLGIELSSFAPATKCVQCYEQGLEQGVEGGHFMGCVHAVSVSL